MSVTTVLECPCDTCGSPLIVRRGHVTTEMTYVDGNAVVRCVICGTALDLAPIGDVFELPLLYTYQGHQVLFV
jgi:hypothetical protein